MKIRLVFYHVFHSVDPENFPEKIVINYEIDSNTTLTQLFNAVGYPHADLSEYYPLSGVFSFNESFLPYIINKNGKIDWSINYENVTVVDFINTHRIENFTIVSKTGYPQCGGPGFKDIVEIWNMVYPVIDQFMTLFGAVSLGRSVKEWFESKLQKSDRMPQTFFDLIYSRDCWNHTELADLLEIEYEESKQLLKFLNYSYDNSRKMYIQQPGSIELREKLSSIEVRDI